MHWRWTQARERLEVRRGRIALVPRQAEAGILPVEFAHVRIAPGLRQDRRGADRGHEIVSAHEGFDAAIPKQISEVRGFVAIDDDVPRAHRE